MCWRSPDGFRAVASDADIVMFVPEGVVLAPGYLAAVRATAERWQDVVGEIDVVHAADETCCGPCARAPCAPPCCGRGSRRAAA